MLDDAVRVYDYGAFLDPPSAIFRDYVTGREGARTFFEGGAWDLAAVAQAAERTLRAPRDRAALAGALARQQRARGASRAAAQAERLLDPRCVAVVTGQQAMLFGGPLYVLYKALAARRLARELEHGHGLPSVPVFWVASDDHDFAEVRSATVLDEGGRLHTLRYAPRQEPVGVPAARVILDETIAALVAELQAKLPAGSHKESAVQAVRDAYRPGTSLAAAFAALLGALLPDVIVLDPADPELKAVVRPVLEREIEEHSPSSTLAVERGGALLAAGYHQQVPVRPGFLNLFVVLEGQRRALAQADGSLEVRGVGRRLTQEEARRSLRERPEDWSPGALLRPLTQDWLLPTAAYVGGPAEIAYHAQIVPSYARFGVPRPVLVPRPGVTLMEPAHARVLAAEGLTLPELQADPEGRLAQWARDAHPQVEAAFAAALGALHRELAHVEEVLAALDPTLRAATDAARGRAAHQVEGLREKATRALKKRDQARADRLRRTRDALMPGGLMQERGLGLIGLVARHGPGILDDLERRIDPWAAGHQALPLGPRGGEASPSREEQA